MKKNRSECVSSGRFVNKIVAITGGARGIGKNIARKFGLEGATVVICDVDISSGRDTMYEFRKKGISIDFMHVDLSKLSAPITMIKRIAKKWGKVDVLVNNARAGSRLGLLEEKESNWDKSTSVMLRASFFASQEAVRTMSKSNGGCIVNVSSISAIVTCHESPSYHIAKAGLLQLTRYLASHAGKYNVHVNAVLPGFIVKDEHKTRYESNENKRYRGIAEFCHPLGQVGDSDDVADAVLFLCSPEASFISGQCLVVDGGLIIQDPSDLLFRFDKSK